MEIEELFLEIIKQPNFDLDELFNLCKTNKLYNHYCKTNKEYERRLRTDR